MTEFSGGEWGGSPAPPNPPRYPYPAGGYPPPPYPGLPPPPADPSNAVAALVIGILALFTAPVGIGLILGAAAVLMGIIARRRAKRGQGAHGGMALAGIMLGVLAIVVGLAISAIFVYGFATDEFNETYQHCLGEHNGMSQYCEEYR